MFNNINQIISTEIKISVKAKIANPTKSFNLFHSGKFQKQVKTEKSAYAFLLLHYYNYMHSIRKKKNKGHRHIIYRED